MDYNEKINVSLSSDFQIMSDSNFLTDELPGSVDEKATPVVYLEFVDKSVWGDEQTASVVNSIKKNYAKFNFEVVTEKPADGEYYTIYAGEEDALKKYADEIKMVYSDTPDMKNKVAFAIVNDKDAEPARLGAINMQLISSIGEQMAALIDEQCPGIKEHNIFQLTGESTGVIVYLEFVDKSVWGDEQTASVVNSIKKNYAKFNFEVVTEKPADGEYYTIYAGEEDALKKYADEIKMVYSDTPDMKNKVAFAIVNDKDAEPARLGAINMQLISSIGEQMAALIDEQCPGIKEHNIFQLTGESTGALLLTPCSVISINAADYGNTGIIYGFNNVTWSDFEYENFYQGYYCVDETFVDAEKSQANPKDENMCWAAAASNILYYTNWITASVTAEDDVLDIFRNSFQYGDTRGGADHSRLF